MKKKDMFLIIISLIIFIAIAIWVFIFNANPFDLYIYNNIANYMSPIVTGIMKVITHFGDYIVIGVLCITPLLFKKTRLEIGVPVSLSVIFSLSLSIILKFIFARQRPDVLRLVEETSYSFPSSHAMVTSAIFVMFMILVFRLLKGKKIKVVFCTICTVLIFLVGISRVYLGVHYMTDVLAGWSLGFLSSYVVYIIWKKYIVKIDSVEV